LPEVMLSPAKRVMNLQQPEKKMSKSDADVGSRILITDEADEIRKKIRRAKTDSVEGPLTYDPVARPGVSNLIEILKHITRSTKTCEEIVKEIGETTLGALKALVAEEIVKELDGVRERYEALMAEGDERVDLAMVIGRQHVSGKAGATMKEVREAVGLVMPGKTSISQGKSMLQRWDEMNAGGRV